METRDPRIRQSLAKADTSPGDTEPSLLHQTSNLPVQIQIKQESPDSLALQATQVAALLDTFQKITPQGPRHRSPAQDRYPTRKLMVIESLAVTDSVIEATQPRRWEQKQVPSRSYGDRHYSPPRHSSRTHYSDSPVPEAEVPIRQISGWFPSHFQSRSSEQYPASTYKNE
ncbi:hypothetical protein GYMLUDRAFT_249929 [Collybiopsis luxurians FD-317 M1]|uniref:Uncharacterized protein n=1 Tax=Collybiopsis luxurians FD-317 M1 TaxID=944289 RepID=A0A0D0C7Z7_9AGAR|nr:hypothetical protein GYMLUDRAFT_249929 [Collybiopsis luxurians FD-317 M1]